MAPMILSVGVTFSPTRAAGTSKVKGISEPCSVPIDFPSPVMGRFGQHTKRTIEYAKLWERCPRGNCHRASQIHYCLLGVVVAHSAVGPILPF